MLFRSLHPSEYQAIAYAVLGYGLLGALLAAPLAVVLRLLGGRVPGARATALTGGVVSALVLVGVLQAQAGGGLQVLPWSPRSSLTGIGVVWALIVTWLGRHLVQKTAFRLLLRPRGAAVAWSALAAVALLLSASPAPGATSGPIQRDQGPGFERRPDVVLVLVSGLGPALEGAPALTALAAESVRFDQAITSGRSAGPAIASVFTSLPPSRHAVEADGATLPESLTTVAEVFRNEGYVTLGLPDDPAVTGARGFGQGFDSYRYRREDPLGAAESSTSLALYRHLRRLLRFSGRRDEAWYTPAETQVARAEELLDANVGQIGRAHV